MDDFASADVFHLGYFRDKNSYLSYIQSDLGLFGKMDTKI